MNIVYSRKRFPAVVNTIDRVGSVMCDYYCDSVVTGDTTMTQNRKHITRIWNKTNEKVSVLGPKGPNTSEAGATPPRLDHLVVLVLCSAGTDCADFGICACCGCALLVAVVFSPSCNQN